MVYVFSKPTLILPISKSNNIRNVQIVVARSFDGDVRVYAIGTGYRQGIWGFQIRVYNTRAQLGLDKTHGDVALSFITWSTQYPSHLRVLCVCVPSSCNASMLGVVESSKTKGGVGCLSDTLVIH